MRTILAMFLLLGFTGARANTTIPLLPGAGENRQGFVRIVHPYGKGGGVDVTACDDSGTCHSMLFSVPANQQVMHFNADDLEKGNAEKGITGIGDGTGDWWLRVNKLGSSPVEALAYMRTKRDGFLTALNGVVTPEDGIHRVRMFNPGSNTNQRSILRLVNTYNETVTAVVRGVDDRGVDGAVPVTVTLPPSGAETLTAQQLEDMGLGDGAGKWRLTVTASEPIIVMSLMETPTGHLTNLSSYPNSMTVPLFPAASANRQGFVRVINETDRNREVTVRAIDDSGAQRGIITFPLAARTVLHFNADDLEKGNTEKGITAVGDGVGDWRLVFSGDVEVLAYMRTKRDGFLTALHDTVMNGQVPTINPASNTNQRSILRLVNPSDGAIAVTIYGVDDSGAKRGPVSVTINANAAVYLTSQQMEDMGLGDGDGKWRLRITATGEVLVMGLMETPTGHLTNLSAVRDDTISVIASPPNASFTFKDDDEIPFTVHFDASSSAGTIVEYAWSFDGGKFLSTGTDPLYTHTHSTPVCYEPLNRINSYQMKLRVTDQFGNTDRLIHFFGIGGNTVMHAGQKALIERINDAGGHAGTLAIWEQEEEPFKDSHADLMYRCAQREEVPAARIAAPGLNVHGDSTRRGLEGFFQSENDSLRAETLVVNRSVFPAIGSRQTDDIREHNIVFVAATANVRPNSTNKCDPEDMPDRDLWRPDHSHHSCEENDDRAYRGAMQAIATGKVLYAASAVRRSDGTIVPNQKTIMCGDTKEYCFAVPSGSTSESAVLLSSSVFHLFQLYERAEDVVHALKSCAEDVGEPGVDREFGQGVLDLRCAEAMLPVIDR